MPNTDLPNSLINMVLKDNPDKRRLCCKFSMRVHKQAYTLNYARFRVIGLEWLCVWLRRPALVRLSNKRH